MKTIKPLIVGSVFEEDIKFYLRVYLDECYFAMTQLHKIEDSKGIDLNKTDKSKECKICYYHYFNNDFKSDSKISNDSDWRIKSIRNFAIIHVNGVGYRFFMTKEDEVAFIKDYESDDKFERINIHETSPSKEYFRCILWSVCEKEAISILNHSVLEDGGIL